jgi:hypothetical protein
LAVQPVPRGTLHLICVCRRYGRNQPLMKTALQPGLSFEKFCFMQAVMRETLGISALQ